VSARQRQAINTILNINAFLVVARLGSFSAAARELDVAPSVVTKRITRLEERVHTRLIARSTRGLTLTPAGERLLPRFLRVVAELDELLIDTSASSEGEIDGHVRIKGPTTITSLYLGALFGEFQVNNPRVTLEVVLMDRSVNPLEENFDLVVGARAASYPNVVDIPLCIYPQTLCCAPAYLRTKPEPRAGADESFLLQQFGRCFRWQSVVVHPARVAEVVEGVAGLGTFKRWLRKTFVCDTFTTPDELGRKIASVDFKYTPTQGTC